MQKRVMSENVKFNKNNLLAAFVLVLLISAFSYGTGETLSYLAANTEPVTNTFVYGDINIKLTESADVSKNVNVLLPGKKYKKDTVITVKGDSESCWLFITMDGVNWPDGAVCLPRKGWKAGTGTDGIPKTVFYKNYVANNANKDESFYIFAGEGKGNLKNGMVNVTPETKAKTDAKKKAQLTVKAYAVQKAGFNKAADAWKLVEDNLSGTSSTIVPSKKW